MNAIQKYTSGLRVKFGEVDTIISEFEKRAAELNALIDDKGGDFSLEAVQETGAIRTELSQVTEALNRALTRRQQMQDDLADNLYSELSAVKSAYRKAANKANAKRVKEIQDLSQKLRRSMWQLRQVNMTLYREFDAGLRELAPFVDRTALHASGGTADSVTVTPPYVNVGYHDERLLRYIDREVQNYNDFNEEVKNG